MDTSRKSKLLATYRNDLLHNTLPFWIEHCVDHKHGGFMMSLDRDGTVVDTDKGVWQQCRFTWLLGELYNNVEPREEWLELAKHGIRFIDEHCYDPSDGRMWFHVTRKGESIRKRRYAFTETFAAIAYGELAKATGEKQYAAKARQTFQRFLDHNRNPQNTEPKFTETRQTRSLGVPMMAIVTAQELRESINLPEANELIDRSIDEVRRYHVKEDIRCVMETVGANGELIDHFDGRTLNPGHSIEAAWFIMLEGKLRNDPDLIRTGTTMLDWMWERGWDQEHGGILYFVDVNGRPVQEYWHDMKFWWPQNEAVIATLLAYTLTGDSKYADCHAQIHDWAHSLFSDQKHREWFGYLRRDGSISSTLKGNLWKGPFHLPRMQLMCWSLLEKD